MESERLICMGTFGRPHGIRGDIRANLHNRFSTSLTKGVFLIVPEQHTSKLKLLDIKQQNNVTVFTLKGIRNRNEANLLKGFEFFLAEDDLPLLEDDEFYVRDLVGLTVFSLEQTTLGTIVDVHDNPWQDILIIEDNEGTYQVPFVDEFILEIDLEQMKVTLDLPSGLRELTYFHQK